MDMKLCGELYLFTYNIRGKTAYWTGGEVYKIGRKKYVHNKGGSMMPYPKKKDIGIVIHKESTYSTLNLWLAEKDPNLAKRMFMEYEIQILCNLRKEIDATMDIIESLVSKEWS